MIEEILSEDVGISEKTSYDPEGLKSVVEYRVCYKHLKFLHRIDGPARIDLKSKKLSYFWNNEYHIFHDWRKIVKNKISQETYDKVVEEYEMSISGR